MSFINAPVQRTRADWVAAWSEATFVLDTNVLCTLYRSPTDESLKLIEFLSSLGGRLWLPYHVALEFNCQQRERFLDSPAVKDFEIAKQKKFEHESQLKSLVQTEKWVIDKLDQLENADRKREEIGAAFQKIREHFPEPNVAVMPSDILLSRISALLNQKIGPPPKSQSEVDFLVKQADDRAIFKIAPGYTDLEKPEGTLDRGLVYKKAAGDFIIWSQILDYSKKNQKRAVFFITEEKKIIGGKRLRRRTGRNRVRVEV